MTIPTGILFYDPQAKPLDINGKFQAGCYLVFYLTGTTSVAPVFADGNLTVSLGNQVTADGNGRFAPLYLNPSTIYRVQLFDANNNKLEDVDPYVPPGVSSSVIGNLLYPPSPGEISNSTQIVNPQYYYGYIERYGGSTSAVAIVNNTALQAAFTANQGAYPVVISGENDLTQVYNFTSTIIIPPDSVLQLVNNPILKWASITGTAGPLWLNTATSPGLYLQGGNISISGLGKLLGPGSAVVGSGGFPGGNSGGPTSGFYSFGQTAIIAVGGGVNSPYVNINISDIEVNGWGYDAIAMQYCEDVLVDNVYIHDCAYHGVLFLSSVNAWVRNSHVAYIQADTASGITNAYGIAFSAFNSSGDATAGLRTSGNAACIGSGATNNFVHDIPRWTGIDTHCGYEMTFIGNEIYNCMFGITAGSIPTQTSPINIYGAENTLIMGNQIRINQFNGAATTVTSFADTPTGIIINGGSGTTAGSPTYVSSLHCRVIGNVIDGYGSLTVAPAPNGSAIQAASCNYAIISDNVIDNWTGVGIWVLANTVAAQSNNGGAICNNTFGPVATTYTNDACIVLDGFATPPVIADNCHNIPSGTAAHFGVTVNTTKAQVAFGRNDFSSAQTAQYGNTVGGSLTTAQFLGNPAPLVQGNQVQLGGQPTPVSVILQGKKNVAGASTAAVTFPNSVTLPNSTYQVVFGYDATIASSGAAWAASRGTTGFTITFNANYTGNVDWMVLQ